jgi:hypothetical protein
MLTVMHSSRSLRSIHREDVSGQNLENGIVHKDADLRNFNYPDYFPNDQSQVNSGNKYVYALVASLDPVSAVKRGINTLTGYKVLGKNEKLVINPGSTEQERERLLGVAARFWSDQVRFAVVLPPFSLNLLLPCCSPRAATRGSPVWL